MQSRLSLLAWLMGLMLLPGCGGPSMAPVTGRVTFNGKPVGEASITFAPLPKSEGDKEPGKAATGFTDAEGKYALSTYRNYDGALVGKHQVIVALEDTNPARCKREKRLTWEVKPGDNSVDIEMDGK
jgi:hypothetical protein